MTEPAAQRRSVLVAAAGLAVGVALPGCASVVPGPSPLTRIAFGSCINQALPQPVWAPILAGRPELFLFGGDNVYASTPPFSRQRLDAAYAKLAVEPGFAQLRHTVPHLAVWDDNDYGLPDGGADFADRLSSRQAFLDFWQVPADDERRQREGVYLARSCGPPGQRVQVILLDVRSHRSAWRPTDQQGAPGKERYLPDADPSKTMLGAAQWAWLAAQLREPADLRLVLSGIQVVADGHGWECWANFPLERQRLYNLIGSTGANGVLLLSGDRHLGAFYREAGSPGRPVPYPLTDFTASGLTHAWQGAAEAGPNRIGPLFDRVQYGTIDIDWPARSVALALRDVHGQARRELSIDLRSLQPA